MKNSELIILLNNLPQDAEVCIFDWRKSLFNSDGEGNGIGIEPFFKVELINESVNIPFIALAFENDDYNEDGTVNDGSLIAQDSKESS
jgi:hypothetical protein